MADMGAGVTKMPGFSDGDLQRPGHQRCRDAQATIHINQALQLPPKGVPDHDVVDAGYASDAIGPYTVSIPVLANDIDGNGPKPTQPSAGLLVLDGPTPTRAPPRSWARTSSSPPPTATTARSS